MKTRAREWFLCPAPWWEDTNSTRQTEELFGNSGRHRIVEVFEDPLLFLFMERP